MTQQQEELQRFKEQLQTVESALADAHTLANSRGEEVEQLQQQLAEEREALNKALDDVSKAEKACAIVVQESAGKTQQLEVPN